MNNSKIIFSCLIITISTILFSNIAFSELSMSPGYHRFEYDETKGLQEEVAFFLRSTFKDEIIVVPLLEENLAEYVEILKEEVTIKSGEAVKIPIKIDIPPGAEEVGSQRIRILFERKQKEGEGFISVETGYRGIILVVFSYPGEYISIRNLKAENVNQGEETSIEWSVRALGSETTGFVPEITIFDADKEKVFYEKYSKKFLERNEDYKETSIIPSQDFVPGNYEVLIEVSSADNYENETTNLRIGEEDIRLTSFEPKNFTIGEIVEFSFTIENLWNGEFTNVYGLLDFENVSTTTRSGKISSFKELKIDKQYIDLRAFGEGIHEGTLTVFFDGNSKVFDVEIEGIKPKTEKSSEAVLIMVMVLVLLIVIFLLIFIFKKVNKKEDENKKITKK